MSETCCTGRPAAPVPPPTPGERSVTRVRRGVRLAGAALCLTAAVSLLGCEFFKSSDDHLDIGANNPGIGLAFGDSISHGRHSLVVRAINDAGPDEPGYRTRLQELFAAQGRAVLMYEDGAPGTLSSEGLARIDEALAVRPAFIVILYGTNDANALLPASELVGNLRAMALRCRLQQVIVVLCTLPPVCRGYQLAKMGEYNPLIRDLAAELGGPSRGVFLADLSRAFYERSPDACQLINPDNGVHPTQEGYGLIAETVFQQLANVSW